MTKKELIEKIAQNIEACIKANFSNIEEVRPIISSASLNTGKIKFEVTAGEETRKAWQEALKTKESK